MGITKVKLEVSVNPKLVEQVGELMSRMDLGITGVHHPHVFTIEFTTTTKVDKKYMGMLSKGLRKTLEEDGDKVISIKRIEDI